jgi:16S rRNA A1518/A1519 N6-dimethyltransferase RsmA/KsgA/DIM1 with predicted DNA glycosylase/AP lyase activity
MEDESDLGHRVVEIGPGAGALTRVLFEKYPKMTAIEIDQRSVVFLQKKLPGIDIIHKNVLEVDWPELALSKGGRLKVIGNLPYYIVSQVLFSLADSHRCIEKAVLTMQLEVAERITASPNTKDYGIPSVVFQLYCVSPKILFKIPPTVFYPAPKVDSALVGNYLLRSFELFHVFSFPCYIPFLDAFGFHKSSPIN